MKVSGEYLFDGPRPLVWQTLLDPEVLAGVLPGCEKLERTGENEYEGALKLKIGPVQGQFMGKVKLENLDPPQRYTMQVDGRGGPGFVKATGNLVLEDAGEKTKVSYDGDAHVGGRLASVGQRLVESSAKAIIKQSLDGLNAAVQMRSAEAGTARSTSTDAEAADDTPSVAGGPVASGASGAGAESSNTPPLKRPSQSEFAAAVAREVAKDLIPSWLRYTALAVGGALLLYMIYALLT